MNAAATFIFLLAFTLIVNLPFGYLRARSKKYSIPWFLYIHLPIPAIIFLRLTFEFTWKAIPFVVAAAVTGQYAGGKMGQR